MWKIALRSKGFWLGVILSCAGLWVALRGVRLGELKTHLATVNWPLAILACAVSFLGSIIRSYRWRISIESFAPVSLKKVLSAFLVGMFGLNVIPARLGEYLRVFVLGKNSSLSQSSILATVVFERVVDGLAVLTIFAVALFLRPGAGLLGPFRREFLLVIPLIFALGFAFLYVLWRHPAIWRGWIGGWTGRMGARGERISGMMDRFVAGLVIFSDLGRLARYLVWSFIAWLSIAFYLYLNFLVLGIPLGFVDAVVVMTAGVVGAMIPAAPGFVGTYHAIIKLALVQLGVGDALALTFAVVSHALQYVVHTVIGFVCALREHVRWTDLKPE